MKAERSAADGGAALWKDVMWRHDPFIGFASPSRKKRVWGGDLASTDWLRSHPSWTELDNRRQR
jgi:hypothetical protein